MKSIPPYLLYKVSAVDGCQRCRGRQLTIKGNPRDLRLVYFSGPPFFFFFLSWPLNRDSGYLPRRKEEARKGKVVSLTL